MSPAHTPAAARDHCLAPTRVVDAPVYGGQYSRLFGDLAPLEAEGEALRALGLPGGACDGAGGSADSATAAGWPFFGQFVAHDITADRSPLTHAAGDGRVTNFRTPRANLECVYAGGQVGSPYLFDRTDPAKLLLAEEGSDVPRNGQGVAIMGDPRNDVHLLVNQLHVGLLRSHNLLVDRLRADGVPEALLFDEARRALMWHYQWVVLHEFLPSLIGEGLAADLLREGASLIRAGEEPYIPFEFADAAYRYGHSQIRESYRIREDGEEVPVFPDLMGFRPVPPERAVDWGLFFDLTGRRAAQRAKRIDGRLPSSLIHLPVEITGEVDEEAFHSLAARDLQRGTATALPSGEAVARRLGLDPLDEGDLGLAERGWRGETPLWYYVLREAHVLADGDRLGPVGGRIVGEVLVAIVDNDPESFRSVDRAWRPTLAGQEASEAFGIADLLAPVEAAPA